MRVRWTSEAQARLEAIETRIAEQAPLAARELGLRLLRRSQQLRLPPLTGRRLPEYPDIELRELLERPFRLIYRVLENEIQIVAVIHYRQHLPTTADWLHTYEPLSKKP